MLHAGGLLGGTVLALTLTSGGALMLADADGMARAEVVGTALDSCTTLHGRTWRESARYVIGIRRYDADATPVQCESEAMGAPDALERFDAGVAQLVEHAFRTRHPAGWMDRSGPD